MTLFTFLHIIIIIPIIHILQIIRIFFICRMVGIGWLSDRVRAWLQETRSLCNPIQSILGKLPVVPVGDTGTIPYHLNNVFPGAPGDRRPGSGDGCRMWLVNLGWWICNAWKGFWQEMPHGKRLHLNTVQHHVLGILPSALYAVCRIFFIFYSSIAVGQKVGWIWASESTL